MKRGENVRNVKVLEAIYIYKKILV